MRIGIGIGEIAGQAVDLDALVAQVQRAEKDGFHSAWLANIFGFDAILVSAICGRESKTIEIGTAVVPTYPRHPTAMAQQALSAQAAARGRFTLGIGLSHQIVIETMLGLSWAKPYSHMKEYLEVLVPLMRTGAVQHFGSEFRVAANLTIPTPKPCPILIAALAPKMLALAGGVADGTITWMTGPKTLGDHTIPRLQEAAAAAGRPKSRVVVGLPIAVTTEIAAAREAAGRQFQIYGALPSYRAMLDREGAEGPADVAIVGDEDAVNAQLDRFAEVGVTDFLAAPFGVGSDPMGTVERTRALLIKRIGH